MHLEGMEISKGHGAFFWLGTSPKKKVGQTDSSAKAFGFSG
jgi:hypothetical protein